MTSILHFIIPLFVIGSIIAFIIGMVKALTGPLTKLRVMDYLEESLIKETKLSKPMKVFDHYVETVGVKEGKIFYITTEEFNISYNNNQPNICLTNGNRKGYLLDNKKQLEELKNFEKKFFKIYNKKKPSICKSIEKWNLTSDKKEKK